MNEDFWPGPGEVHIRLFNLAREEDELAGFKQLLTAEEAGRATRLIAPQIRNRFIVCRALLRKTLGAYLGLAPANITLKYATHGKPFLPSTGQEDHRLCFNLSHSGDLAVLALAGHSEIGIDLEQRREDLPFRAMAGQFFSRREQAELFSLPDALQLSAFYRCWTRKEAYLKGCGSGFSISADSCDVSLLPGHLPALLAHRDDPAEPSRWSLADLDLAENHFAALAVSAPAPVIRLMGQN